MLPFSVNFSVSLPAGRRNVFLISNFGNLIQLSQPSKIRTERKMNFQKVSNSISAYFANPNLQLVSFTNPMLLLRDKTDSKIKDRQTINVPFHKSQCNKPCCDCSQRCLWALASERIWCFWRPLQTRTGKDSRQQLEQITQNEREATKISDLFRVNDRNGPSQYQEHTIMQL